MRKIRIAVALAAVAVLGGASAAMADRRGDERAGVAPLSEHVRTEAGGYELTVHPAFSSAVTVEGASGTTELYRQRGTYHLPGGQTEPPAQHVVRLEGGEHARDLGLVVNDPKHQIARITVELYGAGHRPGNQDDTPVETVVVENNPSTCPYDCDGDGKPDVDPPLR